MTAQADILITIDDARRYYCARGVRRWFETYDLDFQDFLENGVRASVLLATGDAQAERIVTLTLSERGS